jgi:hypothetical protein
MRQHDLEFGFQQCSYGAAHLPLPHTWLAPPLLLLLLLLVAHACSCSALGHAVSAVRIKTRGVKGSDVLGALLSKTPKSRTAGAVLLVL